MKKEKKKYQVPEVQVSAQMQVWNSLCTSFTPETSDWDVDPEEIDW